VTPGKNYQEQTAQSLRDIGLDAQIDVTVEGVRSSYDVDVVVRSRQVGFDLLWLVDCTHGNTPVSELDVLGLSEIVFDVSADRGILMAEAGVEDGALRAAQMAKVQLVSLADLGLTADHALGMAQLRSLQERVDRCRERYWNLSKRARIQHGLRPDLPTSGYSGDRVIKAVESGLNAAFLGIFPPVYDEQIAAAEPSLCIAAETPHELFVHLEPHVADLEQRLDVAGAA
jgi:restriction system protein